jgi:hypothetical protein
MPNALRIGLLSPLQVRDETGRQVHVGGRQLRVLLTLLALSAGRVGPAGWSHCGQLLIPYIRDWASDTFRVRPPRIATGTLSHCPEIWRAREASPARTREPWHDLADSALPAPAAAD